jgi:hypothetical protein
VVRQAGPRERRDTVRIHTDATREQVRAATEGTPTTWHTLEEYGSRTHARAFELRLEGTGGRSNTGLYGAGDYSGATWDEWGAVLGAIYRADPGARMGGSQPHPVYADAEDYRWQTGGRFDEPGMPADTHPRHGWEYEGTAATGAYSVHKCRKCSALKRYARTRTAVA